MFQPPSANDATQVEDYNAEQEVEPTLDTINPDTDVIATETTMPISERSNDTPINMSLTDEATTPSAATESTNVPIVIVENAIDEPDEVQILLNTLHADETTTENNTSEMLEIITTNNEPAAVLDTFNEDNAESSPVDDSKLEVSNESTNAENIDPNDISTSSATVELSTESIIREITPEPTTSAEPDSTPAIIKQPVKKLTTKTITKTATTSKTPSATAASKNATKNQTSKTSMSAGTSSAAANAAKPAKPVPTKKIPVRKASLPGVLGSLSMTNVRAMQQELLNKSTSPVKASTSTLNNGKPSKIVPPKVYPKPGTVSSALSDRITKFIKPLKTTTTNSTDSLRGSVSQTPNVQQTLNNIDGVSSSSTAVSSVNTQPKADGSGTKTDNTKPVVGGSKHNPKIPKKKYHETCFSDDYQSSTSSESDEDGPAGMPSASSRPMARRQQSLPNIMRTELEEEEISVEVIMFVLLIIHKIVISLTFIFNLIITFSSKICFCFFS